MTAAQKGQEWRSRRDELIIEAIASGATQAEVARLAGLTQPAIHSIIAKAKKENQK